MKQQFISWRPTVETLDLINDITIVLDEYASMGLIVTVRQLYYQLVKSNLIPNTPKSYKRIVSITGKGRMAGILDWSAFEDRTRNPVRKATWDGPGEILEAARDQYHEDLWTGQKYYVEVHYEKDAISNLIEPVCKKWDVHCLANKGYSSKSAMYNSFGRFGEAYAIHEKELVIIYVGDHDPSGMDMDRDIQDRLDLFLHTDITHPCFGGLRVKRIALNMGQIEEYNLPENPVKQKDPRSEKYQADFGIDSSWELDAIAPTDLMRITEDAIKEYLDMDMFKEMQVKERENKKKITFFIKDFDDA